MNKLKSLFVWSEEEWERISQKGFIRYLLISGIIRIGLVIGLVTSFMMYLNDIDYYFNNFSLGELLNLFFSNLLYYLIGGGLIALLNWHTYQSRYSE